MDTVTLERIRMGLSPTTDSNNMAMGTSPAPSKLQPLMTRDEEKVPRISQRATEDVKSQSINSGRDVPFMSSDCLLSRKMQFLNTGREPSSLTASSQSAKVTFPMAAASPRASSAAARPTTPPPWNAELWTTRLPSDRTEYGAREPPPQSRDPFTMRNADRREEEMPESEDERPRKVRFPWLMLRLPPGFTVNHPRNLAEELTSSEWPLHVHDTSETASPSMAIGQS